MIINISEKNLSQDRLCLTPRVKCIPTITCNYYT